MLDDQSTIPLYKQLSSELQKKITSGEWKYNQKIPTEPKLCEEYQISRMTVRLALEELKNQGYVYRRQGRGTFVSQPKIEQHLTSFYQFSDDIERSGYKTHKELLSFTVRVDQPELAKKLNVKPEEPLFRIERVHYCNDIPFSVETSYIPVRICPDLTEKQIKENGLYRSLDRYETRPDSAVENFEAILLGARYQKIFQLSMPAAGFYVERLSSREKVAVEFCRSYVRGDMIRYTTFLSL